MGLDDFVSEATTDSMEVDFSAALDFDALVGDHFNFVILEAVPGTVKQGPNAGNRKVVVKLEVTAGDTHDEAGTARSAVGRKVQKDLPLTGKGSGITKKFLKVCEYPGGWEAAESEGISLSALKGLTFSGACRKSSFNEDFTDVYKVTALVEDDL